METLAQRANAGYNEPMDINEQCDGLKSFFKEEFGHAPNPAHIVELSPIEPEPYLPLGEDDSDNSDGSDDSCSSEDDSDELSSDSGVE